MDYIFGIGGVWKHCLHFLVSGTCLLYSHGTIWLLMHLYVFYMIRRKGFFCHDRGGRISNTCGLC